MHVSKTSRIKHLVLGTAAGMALVASTITSAQAAAPLGPGTPGTKNCRGQTEAYFAQFGKDAGVHGIGGFANLSQLPPQTVEQLISAYCAGG
jgi:hypothetical protein